MKEVKNALVGEQNLGAYVSPETKVINLLSEGVLCSSGITEQFEEATFNWD